MLVAWLGDKQPLRGVGVNSEAVAEVRVARGPFATGEARALVASARETRVEKNFMLIVLNEWLRSMDLGFNEWLRSKDLEDR
jgi:hypothetical protein